MSIVKRKIPFTKTTFNRKEEKAIKKCLRSGWVVLGPKTLEFEENFAEYVGAKYAVFVDSGTAALFLAVKCSGYTGEVVIPSLTFVSDAEILIHAGLTPVFGDISLATFCLSRGYPQCIPTHFAGRRASAYGKVTDSCHRIERNDMRFSSSMWCYSFYATKNMSTVQGGMICTNDENKYKWLLKARDHGTTKGTKQRYEGKNPVYNIDFIGWRMKGDDMRASIGIEQLKKLPENNLKRNNIVKRYNHNLREKRIGNHIYPILVKNRKLFIEKMLDAGIQCSVHFRPIHTLKAYKKYKRPLTNTDYIANKIVSLPMFPQMTEQEVDYVSYQVFKTKLII